MRPSRPRFARRLGTRGLFLTPSLVIPAKAGTHISAIRRFLSNRNMYLRMGSRSGTRGPGFHRGNVWLWWAQSTPTAAPRVSPIDRLRTRSAIGSRPVGSRFMITSVAPLCFASSGNAAAG